jgi:hypothetical protein
MVLHVSLLQKPASFFEVRLVHENLVAGQGFRQIKELLQPGFIHDAGMKTGLFKFDFSDLCSIQVAKRCDYFMAWFHNIDL